MITVIIIVGGIVLFTNWLFAWAILSIAAREDQREEDLYGVEKARRS